MLNGEGLVDEGETRCGPTQEMMVAEEEQGKAESEDQGLPLATRVYIHRVLSLSWKN
jgi:hypothetical protein